MVAFLSWLAFVICVAAAVILPLVGLYLLVKPLLSGEQRERWKSVSGLIGGAACVAAVISPLYYEFPDYPNRLYVIEYGEPVEKPWGTFDWDVELAWVTPPTTRHSSLSTVSPITANPKVRQISYTIEGSVVDVSKYLSVPERRREWLKGLTNPNGAVGTFYGDIKDVLKYCQYELNNAHSSELAEFYNPLDVDQQTRFRNLAEQYLNTCLAPHGVKAFAVDFSIS